MASPRKILHVDLDAFFCAVEELHDHSLCGLPFAVGGRPEGRGVVASCSYAARRYGVRSAMPMSRAVRLCPQLRVVRPHHRSYSTVSNEVMALLGRFTPLLEQISIDEAFLDVSDMSDEGYVIARRLQSAIQSELSLPSSIGVATNKLVAKTATDVAKASSQSAGYPNAVLVVRPGEEREFLAPLPADRLWGVGPKTRERLAELGMRTIGDIAAQSETFMSKHFGQHGNDLVRRARGIDDRPVMAVHVAKSVSQEMTFSRDVSDRLVLLRTLRAQAERVGRRLRRMRLGGHTVKLKLRRADFTTLGRQITLSQATDQDGEIYESAVQLFDALWEPGEPVRLLGVGVSGLAPVARQLSFLDPEYDRRRRFHCALDSLKEKFDDRVIRRGSDLLDDDVL